MKVASSLWFLLFCLVSVACSSASYEDVSDTKAYSGLIGQSYRTKLSMTLYGLTRKVESNATIDGYVLEFEPGLSGPEYLDEIQIPAGTGFEVTKVFRCPDCRAWLHGKSTRFHIELSGKEFQAMKDIVFQSIYKQVEVESEDGSVDLSLEFFSKE